MSDKVNDVLKDAKPVSEIPTKTPELSTEEIKANAGAAQSFVDKVKELEKQDPASTLNSVIQQTVQDQMKVQQDPTTKQNFVSSDKVKRPSDSISVNSKINDSVQKPSFMPTQDKPVIQYPVYTVITPQSNDSYTVRTMTVADSVKLKGSYVTPAGITKLASEVLWNCIVESPDHIKTMDDFLNHATPHDRQALLFGLFHITEGEVLSYPVESCSGCGKSYETNFPTGGLAHLNFYEGDVPILQKRVTVDLPISKSQAIVKQYSLAEEMTAINLATELPNSKDVIDDLLYVDKFIYHNSKDITETLDKIDFYNMLPKKDRRKIVEAYNENFGSFNVELSGKAKCPFCGTSVKLEIDFMELFFRLVS